MAKKPAATSKAAKKQRTAEKQTRKSTKSEQKAKVKKGGKDGDPDDVDIEAVLEEYQRQQAQYLKVTETVCEQPSARASCTLVGSPSSSEELFLFGGEYYNGANAKFFNDLFVYQIDKDNWKLITSPNSPLPRSGHAWTRGGNAGGIYLFGGEFSSPKQGTFHHYNDFWHLVTETREWTRIEAKKGPGARSGHRMTYYKQFIILFGGFQDTSQQTKYLNDLWVYDTSKFEWKEIKFAPLTATPDPRSSFTLLPHETGAVLFGGYSRIRAGATAGNSGKGGKQGPKAGSLLTPHVWQDSWLLRIHIREDIKGTEQPPTIRWERRKKPAQLPDPARAGCTMAYHKGRGILFGGVADEEADEERIQSEYFAEMYTWNIAKNRFYPMGVRKRAHQAKRAVNVDRLGSRRDRAKADEEELMANLKRLEAKAQGIAGVSTDDVAMPDAPAEGSNIPTPEKPVLYEMPHRRFNAQLAVVDDTLFIYGGTFEQNDREFTFDEMYSIDLGRMDGLKEVFRRELPNWEGSEDEESESESEDDDEDEDEDADADDDEAVADQSMESRQDKASSPMTDEAQPDPTTATSALSPPEPETPEQEPVEDNLPHPRAFESLRDFFTRTSVDWQEAIIAQKQQASESAAASAAGRLERSIKELRGLAFEQAEQQWWACREEVIRLEDEAEEAGMGEVVNLAERDGGASGAGRRR